IAKDPETTTLIQVGRKINRSMPQYVIEESKKILNEVNGNKIVVFGLTYKGDVDDVRESPAFDIYNELRKETDLEIEAYDTHVELAFVEKDVQKAVKDASLVLILSDHSEITTLKDNELASKRYKNIFNKHYIVINII